MAKEMGYEKIQLHSTLPSEFDMRENKEIKGKRNWADIDERLRKTHKTCILVYTDEPKNQITVCFCCTRVKYKH